MEELITDISKWHDKNLLVAAKTDVTTIFSATWVLIYSILKGHSFPNQKSLIRPNLGTAQLHLSPAKNIKSKFLKVEIDVFT